MSVIDIGSAAIDRDSWAVDDYTWVDAANAANATGTLDTFEIYVLSTGTFKVGTFSYSSPNITNRDYESLGSVSQGSKQTFTGKNCAVSSGDLIGLYTSDGRCEAVLSGATALYYAGSDAFGAGATGTSTFSGAAISLYATGVTPPDPVTTTTNDSTVVTESTGFFFSALNATTSDTVAVTENVSLYTQQKYASVFDTLAITDVANLYTKQRFLTVNDVLGITDAPTLTISEAVVDLNASTYDVVDVSEGNIEYLGQQHLSAFDSIVVTDSNTEYLGQQYITTHDDVDIIEDAQTSLFNNLHASVFDLISIAENNDLYFPQLFIYPTSYLVDSNGDYITDSNGNLIVTKKGATENLSVAENVSTLLIATPLLSITSDAVAVTEQIFTAIPVSVNAYEDVGIVEATEQYFKQKYATTNDSVVISEEAILYFKQLHLNVSDNISVTESVSSSVYAFTPRRRTGLLMGVYP